MRVLDPLFRRRKPQPTKFIDFKCQKTPFYYFLEILEFDFYEELAAETNRYHHISGLGNKKNYHWIDVDAYDMIMYFALVICMILSHGGISSQKTDTWASGVPGRCT